MPAEGRRRGLNLFASKVAALGAQGGSFASVRTYVLGEVTPPLEFVEAAAQVLGVRPAWLAFGDLPRTQRELVEMQAKFEESAIRAEVPEAMLPIFSAWPRTQRELAETLANWEEGRATEEQEARVEEEPRPWRKKSGVNLDLGQTRDLLDVYDRHPEMWAVGRSASSRVIELGRRLTEVARTLGTVPQDQGAAYDFQTDMTELAWRLCTAHFEHLPEFAGQSISADREELARSIHLGVFAVEVALEAFFPMPEPQLFDDEGDPPEELQEEPPFTWTVKDSHPFPFSRRSVQEEADAEA